MQKLPAAPPVRTAHGQFIVTQGFTSRLLKFRKLSNLLNVSANLWGATRSKAVSPTHYLCARYPLPKSLPSGKGLTFARLGSNIGVSYTKLSTIVFQFHAKITISVDNCLSAEYFHCKSSAIAAIPYDDLLIFFVQICILSLV